MGEKKGPRVANRRSATDVIHPESIIPLQPGARDEDEHDDVKTRENQSCCYTKYCNALKTCIPCRPARKNKKIIPANSAGLFSYTSVSWVTGLMWKAFKHGLEIDDIWDIHPDDSAKRSCSRIERLWDEEIDDAKKKQKKPELYRVVFRSIRTRILFAMIIAVAQNIFQFLGPSVLLKLTLDYINEPGEDWKYAIQLIVAIFIVNLLRSSFFNLNFNISAHAGVRLIGGIQSLIYKKVLRLRTGGEELSAQLINIFSNDMERLFEAAFSFPFLVSAPVMFTLSSIYCIYVIGPWAILGLVIYTVSYPLLGLIAKAQSNIRLKTIKLTDQRISLMGEILGSAKLIKMYSWEDSFSNSIEDIRKMELVQLKKGVFLAAITSTLTPSISILGTIATILGTTIWGEPLSASQAFTILSVFNALQFSIAILPFAVRSVAEFKVSLNRIQKLISMEEFSTVSAGVINNNLALKITNATFAWEDRDINLKRKGGKPSKENKSKSKVNGNVHNHEKPLNENESEGSKYIETLFGINLSIERGKLIGVCGSVGSGKSSLISAICGDMALKSGDLQVNGSIAISTQIPWIYNDSLRENIIIGQELVKDKYDETIDVSSLNEDLKLFQDGDLTEIGEKGVNLSGGQKQRVNIARAVYNNRDIYLLDDPLSAVDTKVARNIFNKCIKGFLKDKTVILVTHAIHFLEKCDEIIVLNDGRITERGTHTELLSREGEYFGMVSFNSNLDDENDVNSNLDSNSELVSAVTKADSTDVHKLVKDEVKMKGGVSKRVFLKFNEVCGGWWITGFLFILTLTFTLSRIFNNIWLQVWLDAGDGHYDERKSNLSSTDITDYSDEELKGYINDHELMWMFQLVYGLSFLLIFITGVIKSVGIAFRVLAGSSKLHKMMYNSIMRSPLSFFDTTPSGRILNRFSRDIDEMDVRIPFFLEFVFQGLLLVLTQLVTVCYFFPWFIIPLLLIAVLFFTVDRFLISGVRELKRIDNTLKSPVLQHVTETISGLTIIRTYNKEELFLDRFYKFLDNHSVAWMIFRLANRWFTFRMDILALFVTISITVICIFTKNIVSTATVGFALSTVNGICVFIPFIMRMKGEFISRITALERIIEYVEELPSEAPRILEQDKSRSNWPSKGCIELNDVKLRYRPDLPLVLHGLSGSILSGEKIGIVGRTGAGKSSLISILLRLVELDSGKILIDDVDIKNVGLHTLRSSISVIPQDPVLFKGTIRYNLDPFNEHNDDDLWQALERSHFKSVISKLDHGLLAKVEAGGENFSVGEKQLLCLTRALLRNNKILLLDEATASVDMETDHLIQVAIKEAFELCTVLTIAHRLNTVTSYDRIMVLDAGHIMEFDSPHNLMQKDSIFKDMMKAMGVSNVQQMLSLQSR